MKHSCKLLIKNMADVQTDHDMADVAVVEHTHPHEHDQHVEWEHPEKLYFDEDDGTPLDPEQVLSALVNRANVRRRQRCGLLDGVTDGKVTQCEAELWCDSAQKEQIPVYLRVHQDQLRRGFCSHPRCLHVFCVMFLRLWSNFNDLQVSFSSWERIRASLSRYVFIIRLHTQRTETLAKKKRR